MHCSVLDTVHVSGCCLFGAVVRLVIDSCLLAGRRVDNHVPLQYDGQEQHYTRRLQHHGRNVRQLRVLLPENRVGGVQEFDQRPESQELFHVSERVSVF